MFWYDLFDMREPGPPFWPVDSPSLPISDAIAIVARFTRFCDVGRGSLSPALAVCTRLFGISTQSLVAGASGA